MNEPKRPAVVREPMQVYLDVADRSALDRAAEVSGLSRAEVLRRGLRRFAAELLAAESPALAFLEQAAAATPESAPPDAAVRHDDYLADWELAAWESARAADVTRRPDQ